MTPFLSAGHHTVRFDWSNVYRHTTLQVDSVRLFALTGPDADLDGIPDWTETRLAKMSAVSLPQSSFTSPVCVEGGDASFIEAIELSGYYVASGENDPEPPVRRIAGNRWYADLPLDPDGETPVSVAVSYQDSAVTVAGSILWEPLDVASLDEIEIRKGDALLLGAELPSGVSSWTLEVDEETCTMANGELLRQEFDEAGEFTVTASWTDAGGMSHSNSGVVTVVEADFGHEPVCHARVERRWLVPGVGIGVPVEIDDNIQSADLGVLDGARRFILKGTRADEAYATARLRENGPVLATTAIHVIETATHVGDGYHRILADFGDGSVLYDGYVVAGTVVPGMTVQVTLWGGGSAFEDGTYEKEFTWDDFDSSGELHFNVVGWHSFFTCMSIRLYQDGEQIWQLQ